MNSAWGISMSIQLAPAFIFSVGKAFRSLHSSACSSHPRWVPTLVRYIPERSVYDPELMNHQAHRIDSDYIQDILGALIAVQKLFSDFASVETVDGQSFRCERW